MGENKVFWEGVRQCREEMEQQQAEMDALEQQPDCREGQIISPTSQTPTTASKLTPKELEELVQRERAKGNPWALFAGSCYDPNDPEDKVYWAAIHEHRRQMELQLAAMETLAESESQP